MAVKGKGKQVAGKSPASFPSSSSSAGKRKPTSQPAETSARRKKKRPGVLQFFDDAAVDADSDGEDDIEDEDLDLDFMDDVKAGMKDAKGGGKSRQLPFFLKEEDLSGDELEELIKDRYGQGSEYVVYEEDSKGCDDLSSTHSMKDPTIWRVKCMVGRERQIVFCLMQKFVDLHNFGTELQIISVFALDHVKGYVYIEADKGYDITEACKGLCSLYSSRIGLVPRNEVPSLFSIRNKLCEVSEGMWVRMKNGKYKGDLGQVVAVDDVRGSATVKLIPRVDLQAIAKKFGGGASLKQAAVCSPRLINSQELENFRPHIQVRRDSQTGELFEVLDGLMLKDGYLYKKVSIGSLICWGIQPSDTELLKFTDANKNEDENLNWLSVLYGGRKKTHFSEASDNRVESKKGSGFDLHDLVLFGKKDFGVIVAIEKDGFQILKGNNLEGPEVVTVKMQEIKNGCADKMFIASDCHMKTISIDDVVKVSEGPLQGRQGIVKHMYRGTLFIYEEHQSENSGFFCAKSQLCENVSVKKPKVSYGENLGSRSSLVVEECPSSPRSDIKSCQDRVNRYRQSASNQPFSIGQTLRIRIGPLKGYLCRVVRIYRSDITVKLDSLVKVITVKDTHLSFPISREDTAAKPLDLFGTQESQSIGAPADEGSWDAGLPTTARDSWHGFSASALSFDCNNDSKADQEQGADPWGNKATMRSRDEASPSNIATDSWGKGIGSSGEQNSAWNKTMVVEKSIDDTTDQVRSWEKDANWNKTAGEAGQGGTDGWEKAKLSTGDAGESWGRESIKGGNQVNTVDNATGSCDKSRSTDGNDWDKAATSKDKGKGVCWEQTNNHASEVITNDKADAWDIKGKSVTRNEEDTWGKSFDSPSGTGAKGTAASSRNQAEAWDNASESRTPSAVEHGGQAISWDKAKIPSGGQSESWDKAKDITQGQTDLWNKSKPFGGDPVSCWNKEGNDEEVGRNKDQKDNWHNPRTFEGGHEFGQGRGRYGGRGNRDQEGNWNKTNQGTSWGGDGEAGGVRDQGDNWKQQRNFDGGRGSGRGRGRGRYGAGGSRDQDDSWDKPRDFSEGWGSGRGRGRSQNSEAGEDRDDPSGTRPYGWGRGGGRGRGHGRGQSSDWGDDQKGGWGKSESFGRNESAGNEDQDGSWSKGKSFEGNYSSGWKNGGQDDGGNKSETCGWEKHKVADGDQGSSWPKVGNMSKSSDHNQSSNWNQGAAGGGDSWNMPKPSDSNRSSAWNNNEGNNENTPKASAGSHSSGWGNISAGNEAGTLAGGVGGSLGRANPSDGKESSGWSNKAIEIENQSNTGGGDSWSTGKLSLGGHADGASNWNTSKDFGTSQPSDWSKKSNTSKVEAGQTEGNWNASKTNSGGKQSSGWNNDEGNSWNKPKAFGSNQSSAWNDRSAGNKEDWRTGDQSENWNSGRTFGNDDSSGWRGSMSSNRGRGRGRDFGGGRSSGWNSGEGADNEGNGDRDPANFRGRGRGRNFGGGRPSGWNGGEGADNEGNGDRDPANFRGRGRGRNFGGGRSFGWNGGAGADNEGNNGDRDPTNFRGRGRGRNFGGGRSSGWNGGADADNEGNGDRDPTNFRGRVRGMSFGGGQSSGWNGGADADNEGNGDRNPASFRGRGRGRNFGGGWSSGWYGGAGADNEGNGNRDPADSFNSPKPFGRGSSSGWSQDGWANKGGGDRDRRGSWNSEKESGVDHYEVQGGNKGVDGSTNQMGGWNPRETTDKGLLGAWKPESGNQASGGTSGGTDDWSQQKGSQSSKNSGWNTGPVSARETTAGQTGGWNEKKGSDGSRGWNSSPVSAKEVGGSSRSGEEAPNHNQGEVVKEADAGGHQGDGWEKAAGSWDKPKDGGGKGGW